MNCSLITIYAAVRERDGKTDEQIAIRMDAST